MTERLYHEIACPSLTKTGACSCTPVIVAEASAQNLSFDDLRRVNKLRCETAFHQVDEWKPWEWSNAMAGEVGEACAEGLTLLSAITARAGGVCNLTKKMARVWPANQFKQNWNKPEDQRISELEDKLANELADVVIYADLLATRIGRSLGDCVRQKFNEKSDEIGSPIKLAEAALQPANLEVK